VGLGLDQPQDDVAIALAWAARAAELVDDLRLEPDEALSLRKVRPKDALNATSDRAFALNPQQKSAY
jgi:hypothetical protein